MSDNDNELLSVARLGIDAESFVNTPLGKFMMGKARDEEASAMAALVDADPDDVKANRDIRNQIHVARMFATWIGDAITIGHQAHQQLQEIDDLERFR